VALLAQAVIAIPLVVFVSIFGFTMFEALNVAIGILGYYSLAVAIFNLIPVHPFDGAKAWHLVPELIKRTRSRGDKPKCVVGWRGWQHRTSSPQQIRHKAIYRP